MDAFQLQGWFWQRVLSWTPERYAFVDAETLYCCANCANEAKTIRALNYTQYRVTFGYATLCKHRISAIKSHSLPAGRPEEARWNTREKARRLNLGGEQHLTKNSLERSAGEGPAGRTAHEWSCKFDATDISAKHISTSSCGNTSLRHLCAAESPQTDTPIDRLLSEAQKRDLTEGRRDHKRECRETLPRCVYSHCWCGGGGGGGGGMR